MAHTLTITSSAATLAGVQFATITFVLEAESFNFELADAVAVNGTLSEFASQNSTTYTAKFTPTQDFEGQGDVTVAAATYTDGIDVPNDAGALSPKITIDTLRPTVAITASSASLTRGQTSTITFTTSSTPVLFAGEDVATSGGTFSGFTGSGTVYTATFTPQDNYKGNGSVSVAQGKFFDLAGNINVAASLALTIDTEPVVVEVDQLHDTTVTETMTDKGSIEWTAKESYLVKLDARNSNFVAVADNGLVPQVGDNGSFGRRVLHVHTRTFSYYKNNPMMCHVEVQYVGKQENELTPEPGQSQEDNDNEPDNAAEDPTTWQKITVTTEQRQTLLTDHGIDGLLPTDGPAKGLFGGVPASNAAGDPIDGLTEDRALVKMVYADSMVDAPNFKNLLSFVNKINAKDFLGGAERTVRCMGFNADYDQKSNQWSVSLEFLYDPSEHRVQCYNAGFNEKVGGNRVAIMTDDNLHPVSKPVALKGDGTKMPIADAAVPNNLVLLNFYPYRVKDFSNIWDDCGLTFVNRF